MGTFTNMSGSIEFKDSEGTMEAWANLKALKEKGGLQSDLVLHDNGPTSIGFEDAHGAIVFSRKSLSQMMTAIAGLGVNGFECDLTQPVAILSFTSDEEMKKYIEG